MRWFVFIVLLTVLLMALLTGGMAFAQETPTETPSPSATATLTGDGNCHVYSYAHSECHYNGNIFCDDNTHTDANVNSIAGGHG
jgi:hypothetical protein